MNIVSECIGYLKSSPVFNISLASKELFHSNFIAWLAAEYPAEMASAFGFEGCCIERVELEKSNVDITLTLSNETRVVVENKVKSIPYAAQLNRYVASGKGDKYVLLTLSEPACDVTDSAPEWVVMLYDEFIEKLHKILNASKSWKSDYHQLIISDYIEFVRKLVLVRKEFSIENQPALMVSLDVLRDIRMNDFVQRVRFNEMSSRLQKELAKDHRISHGLVINKEKRNSISTENVYFSSGFSKGEAILDMKYVYSVEPLVLLGLQLQGGQLRSVVESDNLDVAMEWLKKLESVWVDMMLRFFQYKSDLFIKSNPNKDFGTFAPGFLYRYVKVDSSISCDLILQTFKRGVEIARLVGSGQVIDDWRVRVSAGEHGLDSVFIREVVDWGCSEYNKSGLTAAQRYEIMNDFGLDLLACELSDLFVSNNKPYDADRTVAESYMLVCRELAVPMSFFQICDDVSVNVDGIYIRGDLIPVDVSSAKLLGLRYSDVINASKG